MLRTFASKFTFEAFKKLLLKLSKVFLAHSVAIIMSLAFHRLDETFIDQNFN
jgi:hypothetical protein